MKGMDPEVANRLFEAPVASNGMDTPRDIGERCRRAHEGEGA